MQFMHVNGNHWTLITGKDNRVKFYDSLYDKPSEETIIDICRYIHTDRKAVTIDLMNVEKQKDGTSCGVYAIAFAASFAGKEDPTQYPMILNL